MVDESPQGVTFNPRRVNKGDNRNRKNPDDLTEV